MKRALTHPDAMVNLRELLEVMHQCKKQTAKLSQARQLSRNRGPRKTVPPTPVSTALYPSSTGKFGT